MSQYTDEVTAEVRSLLEKNKTDGVLDLVRRKLNTSWRNGYKSGHSDGKSGKPNKTDEQEAQEATS